MRRFRERETVAWKQHKIGPEDWRKREKWNRPRPATRLR
jgi:polyphosphate kinase 2 (PPK2 family)